jgi:hypothetical protein
MFFPQKNIFPFLCKVFGSTLAILFYEAQENLLYYSALKLRIGNSCVEGGEVKLCNAISRGDGP